MRWPGSWPRAGHQRHRRPRGLRPAHRPRLREVEAGRYRTPKQGGHIAQVFAPSGRLVLQREVTFSEFGTFDFGFDLDDRAELGDWRVQTLRADGAPAPVPIVFARLGDALFETARRRPVVAPIGQPRGQIPLARGIRIRLVVGIAIALAIVQSLHEFHFRRRGRQSRGQHRS